MPSLTVENYLKATLQLELKSGKSRVSPGALSARLGVSPGTVTSMLKTLSESGLANYVPYEGVELTESGRRLALRMLRRHRLIELFLHSTLNLPWDRVHDEAEELEHAVSEFLIDRIDDFLGHPETDPHGSPIPASDGEMRGDLSGTIPLAACPVGRDVRFVRVVNQESDFLRYLSESGFQLGAVGHILENSEDAGVVRADIDGQQFTVGLKAAQTIRVVPVAGDDFPA
ncbi:MAG: metal-dependent transcriptional regulator [Fuerstiella sp.]